ncbi:excalibur calcium-binding domain-containing protein [Mycobacterium sp. Aquia_216]|uniref:excalibur calcium-binding domain-containing protein n=1 Tax=Mycobacterium sp. Aquia_216 TaxID=2991729 RepID=UPI003FA3ACF0
MSRPPYANSKAAAAGGRYNIPRGDPAYQQKLDRDNDGIACESHRALISRRCDSAAARAARAAPGPPGSTPAAG